MSFPNLISLPLEALGDSGFNPCFSGCLSRTLPAPHPTPSSGQVSILVLVDVFPERPLLNFHPPESAVSILVLVDVFPELIYSLWIGLFNLRFNPCFSGCLSRTLLAGNNTRKQALASFSKPTNFSHKRLVTPVDVHFRRCQSCVNVLFSFHFWFQMTFSQIFL